MEWNNDIYINVHDNQGTYWALGRIGTAEQWREQAIDWASGDDMEGTCVTLRDMNRDEVPDYVSDVWDIQLKKLNELTHEEFDDIKEFMHLM